MKTDRSPMERAMKAYLRIEGASQPSTSLSKCEEIIGKKCVFLRNCNGVLKVYRILNSGKLKGYKKVQKSLDFSS